MGRYYNGQISGKFWFAVQCSLDASHFGVEPTDVYRFYGCDCVFEQKVPERDAYCDSCYCSFDEHLKDSPPNSSVTWCATNYVDYDFTDIDEVRKRVAFLEKRFGSRIKKYTLIDGDEIAYDVETYSLSSRSAEYVARLCLGRQILYCMETKGRCCFRAEM